MRFVEGEGLLEGLDRGQCAGEVRESFVAWNGDGGGNRWRQFGVIHGAILRG